MPESTINVGVIGLGFMGQVHVEAVQSAAAAGLPCTLAAVCDRDASRLSGVAQRTGNLSAGDSPERLFDPAKVKTHTDPLALLRDDAIHLVCVCTHTDTHRAIVLAALKAGKHVLCEKPVALDSIDVREIAEAAYRHNRLCMPAMCMRFWPGWTWLKDRVRDASLGRLRSVTFQRLGAPPAWSPEFYKNAALSGGAIMDLHIHDADFVYWLLGRPDEVVSTGNASHVTTLYRYSHDDGPVHVVAEGAQDFAPGFGFKMRYAAAFERATADFDLSRTPQLLLIKDNKPEPIELPTLSGYDAEVRHIIQAIAARKTNDDLVATIDDALAVARMLEAEKESLSTGRIVPVT